MQRRAGGGLLAAAQRVNFNDPCLQQSRGLQIADIFSKQKRAERKARLKEDMQHGCEALPGRTSYDVFVLQLSHQCPLTDFDDFRPIRDQQGRIWPASSGLIPAEDAVELPQMAMLRPDGTRVAFPGGLQAQAALLSIAFRSGAEELLDSWRLPWRSEFEGHGSAKLVELSFVESVVMSVWPFKQAIMSAQLHRKQPDATEFLFHFGDCTAIRKAIIMPNRLTGYAVLCDRRGLVRWKGSGLAADNEVQALLNCTRLLLTNPEQ